MSFKNDCEGLSKTLMDIKLTAGLYGFSEKEREIACQIFPAHDDFSDRVRKSCYYGKLPPTDRPSLPLTQIAVEQFSMVGLQKLSRLDIARAADMSRDACASPASLVFSLIYLDRLRRRNPEYLRTVSSADLFLVSMMVASKFLYDDGEEDEVFNDEWAKSGQMEVKDFNKLEVEFLSAIDWNVNVPKSEFESALKRIEQEIAYREFVRRDWATYSDLEVLSHAEGVTGLWKYLAETALRMTTVCMAAYAASIFTLLGSTALLNQTPFGPDAVANSYRTLSGEGRRDSVVTPPSPQDLAANSNPSFPSSSSNLSETGGGRVPGFAGQHLYHHHHPDLINLNPAELLTASMLVASIKSSPDFDESEHANGGSGHEHGGRGAWAMLDHNNKWVDDGHHHDRGGGGGGGSSGGGGKWTVNGSLHHLVSAGDDTTLANETTTYDDVPAWILERTEFIPHATDSAGRTSSSGIGDMLLTRMFYLLTSSSSKDDRRVPDLHSADSASSFLDSLHDQDMIEEDEEVRSLALAWTKSVWRQLTSHRTDDTNTQKQCPLRNIFRSSARLHHPDERPTNFHPHLIQPLPVSVF